jgi:uncharacterized protein
MAQASIPVETQKIRNAMNRSIFHWSMIAAICLTGVGAAWYVATEARQTTSTEPIASVKKQEIVDLRSLLTLELAVTTAQKELGLGKRDALPKNHGMLFFFEKSGIHPFWMKGMTFPIDIIWINHGLVQEVVRLDPPVDSSEKPAWHTPTHFADRVLELNVGEAEALGIRPGAFVLMPEAGD